MKLAFAALAMVGVVLAGCLGDVEPGPDADEAHYVVPAVPGPDGVATLAWLEAFVGDHPVRRQNLADHVGARDALEESFRSSGFDVWRHNFTDGIEQQNIVAIQWGVVRDAWVVVAGHYDTFHNDCLILEGSPLDPDCPLHVVSEGAYDNGSGVAMVDGLARAFADVTPYYTIAWTQFDGEERGTQGSAALINALFSGEVPGASYPYEIRGHLDLDMIGLNWPGVNAPIYFHHADAGEVATRAIDRADELGFPPDMFQQRRPTISSSDYANFQAVGAPTTYMVSDFEELGAPGGAPVTTPTGVYPWWHLADTYETMLAMAGTQQALDAGFQSSLDIAATIVHGMCCDPGVELQHGRVAGA